MHCNTWDCCLKWNKFIQLSNSMDGTMSWWHTLWCHSQCNICTYIKCSIAQWSIICTLPHVGYLVHVLAHFYVVAMYYSALYFRKNIWEPICFGEAPHTALYPIANSQSTCSSSMPLKSSWILVWKVYDDTVASLTLCNVEATLLVTSYLLSMKLVC